MHDEWYAHSCCSVMMVVQGKADINTLSWLMPTSNTPDLTLDYSLDVRSALTSHQGRPQLAEPSTHLCIADEM